MIFLNTQKFKTYFGKMVDVLLPPRCFHCGEETALQGELCGACWKDLNFITNPQCKCCGIPFELDAMEDTLCGACVRSRPQYDMARSATKFDDKSRVLIYGLKYGDKLEGARGFGGMLKRAGDELITKADVIIPVPLHRRRLFVRRFNQAAIIAQSLGKLCDVPVDLFSLERHKPTISQVGLTKRERHKNVRNSFRIDPKNKEKVCGKNILIIDDVLTTGATVEACAKILKKAGASQVSVLTLSRVVGPAQDPI